MPITSERMMRIVDVANRLIAGRVQIQKWALSEPPELDEARKIISDPECTVDDARRAAQMIVMMYNNFVDRVQRVLIPSFEDMEIITAETKRYEVTHKHNAASRESMRRSRLRKRDATLYSEDTTHSRPLTRAEFDALRAAERVVIPPKQQAELDAIWAKPTPAASPAASPTPAAKTADTTPPDDARTAYERERAERQREAEATAAQRRDKLI